MNGVGRRVVIGDGVDTVLIIERRVEYEEVDAGAAPKRVVAAIALDNIAACATLYDVAATAAVEDIGSRSRGTTENHSLVIRMPVRMSFAFKFAARRALVSHSPAHIAGICAESVSNPHRSPKLWRLRTNRKRCSMAA